MWRIKALTEKFGACGVGWKYEIIDKSLENGGNDEIAAFVTINLFYKNGDSWSEPIIGFGGSMFVSKEKNGLYTSDECFKMAFTDALGIACKAIGMGADIYFSKDRTKYDLEQKKEPLQNENKTQQNEAVIDAMLKAENCTTIKELEDFCTENKSLHSDKDFKTKVMQLKNKLS